MKTLPSYSFILAAVAFLSLTTAEIHARAYGVTRGGHAYAAGPRGVAVAGPHGAAVAGRRGVTVAGDRGVAVARRPYGAVGLPGGYIRTVPVGARPIFYGGYSCMFVGGVYYRPVIYGGDTVYVIVN